MADCCNGKHLVILGGGSAAFAAALHASELGASKAGYSATIINDGLPIGGTCVNVGCVPSKTLIRAAEAHHRADHHGFRGIEGHSRISDFQTVIQQKQELVETLRQAKYLDVVEPIKSIRRIDGHARVVATDRVEVDGETISADRILIATGAAPSIPEIPGLDDVDFLTNETAFELDSLPASMIVLGGRYIALETAQMFARFGTRVTVLQRSDRILPTEASDLTDELTGYLEAEGLRIVTGVAIDSIERENGQVRVRTHVQGNPHTFDAARLVVATGRKPNSASIGLEELGVQLDDSGFVAVDDTLQTSVSGIYAAGDVIGGEMFVYTAAYEGRLAAANALSGEVQPCDYGTVPWVIFTDPQLAGIGLDEVQARLQGLDVEVAKLPLAYVPRALAARDTRGFVKLVREAGSLRLLGARILAPEGSELLMELSLAIRYRVPTPELAAMLHPYLTLSEAVKLAAISFGKDVTRLSCCAA